MREIVQPEPYKPPNRHVDSCICYKCMTVAQHRFDYQKARKIFNDNGF